MSSKATRLETLLEAVRDALVGMDQKGVIRFVNRHTELLFGYDRDDLIGEPIEKLVPETLWQIYSSHREEYFADPRTRSSGLDLDLSGRHKDGRGFPVHISLSHIDTGDVLLVITAAGDVAKQKNAVKNAELMSAIVEYSDDAIIGTTREGMVTSWNPAAERMYGYPSKEIIGRSIKLLIPGDRADEFSATLDRTNRGETIEPRESVRVRKDGSVIRVLVTAAPLRDEEDNIIGTSAVHRDVTERWRAAQVTQRLAAIVESSDDAIIGKTLEGIITSWNPAAERIYGYPSEEIIGQPISLLMPKDRHNEMEEILGRIKADQHVEHFETVRVRKDGTVFPVSVTISPIHDPDGTIVGASAIARDLSQVRRAFEAAQHIEAIVESSDDAIIGRTLEGIITSWNPAAERLYGYSSEEVVGTSFERLVPEDRLAENQELLASVRAGRHVERLETIRVRKDGTMIPISLTLSPMHYPDGKISGVFGIGRDLSERELAAKYARSLIEVGLDPMVTISREGKITEVNEATVKITGVPRDKLIGSDYSQYLTEPGKAIELIREVFSRGALTEVPLTVRHQDGTLTRVLCNAAVYRDFNGDVLGLLATGRDVTKTQ